VNKDITSDGTQTPWCTGIKAHPPDFVVARAAGPPPVTVELSCDPTRISCNKKDRHCPAGKRRLGVWFAKRGFDEILGGADVTFTMP